MTANKSLCDTCLYKHSCERSDAGISWANHSVCYGYVTFETQKLVNNGMEQISIKVYN